MQGSAERARAVEVLHERYAGAVYHKCKRMLGDPSEAEDAVQETFVRAYKSLESFEQRSDDGQLYWLYKTATYVCLHLLRTRRRRRLSLFSSLADQAVTEGGQERELAVRRSLRQVVDGLDRRDQLIVVAHWLDGMNQTEVAALLGISRRAVVKRLTALRKRAAPLLAQELVDA